MKAGLLYLNQRKATAATINEMLTKCFRLSQAIKRLRNPKQRGRLQKPPIPSMPKDGGGDDDEELS
jgi:hypothetical protein